MDHTGQRRGNYQLTRLLGRGGFAHVSLGEHIYLKTVAGVKILQAQLTTPDALEAFVQEGRTLAHLVHPSIIRVLDCGVEQSVPYLIMEYAPNGTLRQRHAKRVPLPVQQVIAYTTQVASALQYAHDRRLIHRDVKPENMLVSANGTILLSDFGISLVARTSHALSVQEISGTAGYMAPEQFQGKAEVASDQYALAVTVYEWLSGHLPFRGSFMEIASQHMFVQPPSLRKSLPALSQEIEHVVMTGLSKDPSKRFTRIEAFARALEIAGADPSPTSIMPLSPSAFPLPPAGNASLVQATPAPERPAPLKNTTATPHLLPPVSEAPVSDLPLPGPNTPIPRTIAASGPVSGNSARRTFVAGIAGATLLVVAASVGVTYAVLSHQHTTARQPLSPSASARQTTTAGSSQPTTGTTTRITGQRVHTSLGNNFPVGCAVWSPNSRRIASSGLNVQVWDAFTGVHVVEYNGHISQVEAVDWSPDGQALVSCGDDQTLQVWDAATGTTRLRMSGHLATVWAVRWSPDGSYLASGSGDTRVGIWDARQGSNLFFYRGHSDTAYAVGFSADSQRVASASYDMTVQVWQATSGGKILTYTGHRDHVLAVAWAPLRSHNPSYIASGSNDTTVQVWDANAHGQLIMRYTRHTSTVFTLCWSPDGRRIASGDAQGQIHVWDVASGRTIFLFTQHTSAINWISWSPDGQSLASASKDQSVRVWRAPR